jgi:serine protease AprX
VGSRRLVAAVVFVALLLTALASVSTAHPRSGPALRVIVSSADGFGEAAAAVLDVRGHVDRKLPIANAVSTRLSPAQIRALRVRGLVVTRDDEIAFQVARPDPTPRSPWIQKIVRSQDLWKRGIKGTGVTVALLDTGVYAASPDLTGRVIHCEDFSGERNTDAHCQDTFGHGTFMAGLIAGNGSASRGRHTGAAPEANLVSVKVAGFDGSTDISHVLAGIQWVVAHRDVYGVKVLNLSLGSDSAQDYRLSPLNLAVENAWRAGIVTVVSAGNSGPDGSTVMKPGDDPYVVTVGASNDEGTLRISDDKIPVFSSRGPTRSNGFAKPDLVSPGIHTVSLRSPGSAIDQQFGSARVGTDYFRGTGTSMATATVSGIVAQILQRNPTLTPDQVKHRLLTTARTIATTDPTAAGEGLVDAYASTISRDTGSANQGLEPASGLGEIQPSRGSLSVDVQTPLGWAALQGEYVAQIDLTNPVGLVPFVSLTYATVGWDPLTWDLTTWATATWAETAWDGTQWRATVWDGTQWRGTQWRNVDWDGTQWRYAQWDGTQWRASTWQSKWYAAAWD